MGIQSWLRLIATWETLQVQIDVFFVNSHSNATSGGSICWRFTQDLPLGCLQGETETWTMGIQSWPSFSSTVMPVRMARCSRDVYMMSNLLSAFALRILRFGFRTSGFGFRVSGFGV